MCIICIKPVGAEMPQESTIKRMFWTNDDGCGYMYPDNGSVKIRKGFMTVTAFTDSITALEHKLKEDGKSIIDIPLIMHFRIGTAGGNTPENTHPFPLTNNISIMQKKRLSCSVGIVHNGIIPITPHRNDISDTMEYIASMVYPMEKLSRGFYKNPIGKKMIDNFTGSKLAFMDSDGNISMIGKFIEDCGLFYSNTTYKGYDSYYSTGYNRCYAWYDDEDYYNSYYPKSASRRTYTDLKQLPTTLYQTPPENALNAPLTQDLEYIEVQPLDDINDYVITPDGGCLTIDDGLYYIDEYLNVYEYHNADDLLSLRPDCTAYSYNTAFVHDEYASFNYQRVHEILPILKH